MDVTTVDTPSIKARITPPIIAFLKATFSPPERRLFNLREKFTSDSQNTSSNEAGNNCIPRVILLSVVNQQAIHGRKHTSPHSKTSYRY
jgi:hypothetical protein